MKPGSRSLGKAELGVQLPWAPSVFHQGALVKQDHTSFATTNQGCNSPRLHMSKRRTAGEIARRSPGSGFCGSTEPELVRVPAGDAYIDEAAPCMMGCSDPECREWANLEIVSGEHVGHFMYHISECDLDDAGSPSPGA